MKNTENRTLILPLFVTEICRKLEEEGYAAYAVGGCVRDMLMGRMPDDYDVTTAAPPSEIERIFSHTVPTGLLHGTVTVITGNGKAEVTTFRTDGEYSDKRRPDKVVFVPDIETDLARRDFTVNAIAYSPTRGLCDPFGGVEDLRRKCLRTVGDPEKRFDEDALRIMRLYRFSAQLSFHIEEWTRKVADEKAASLSAVSVERIFAELSKLFRYADKEELCAAKKVLCEVLPEGKLSENTFKRVAACPSEAAKWAILCGKKTEMALRRLHACRALCMAAKELAFYKKGKEILWDTACLRYAAPEDLFAYTGDKNAEEKWKIQVKKGMPRKLSDLAITGRDAKEAGFSGQEIGKVLERVFMYVIANPGNNKREILKEVLRWI